MQHATRQGSTSRRSLLVVCDSQLVHPQLLESNLSGLLSMPYAMNMAGWAGLAAILLCSLLFCTSGKMMTWGLEALPSGVAHSYPELGRLAFGASGRSAVMAVAACELLGGSCLIMIVIWKQLQVRGCGVGVSAGVAASRRGAVEAATAVPGCLRAPEVGRERQ